MKIGKIVSVEYDKFRVRLFHTTKNSTVTIQGWVYYFGNIGSYLKTVNSLGEFVLCEVVAVVDYNVESQSYSMFNLDTSRELVVKPIGTFLNDEFKMGVGIYPSLYNDVEIVSVGEMNSILVSSKEESVKDGIHQNILLGSSKNMINYQIKLDIDRLFNIHSAVLGNSGSGKSNTIAHLLQEVLSKSENAACGAKFILFDVNGEYASAFQNCSFPSDVNVESYRLNEKDDAGVMKFTLPYYLMSLDEWLAFLMASDRVQKPFWNNVLQQTFKFFKIFNSKEDEIKAKFLNYMKYKILNILKMVSSQVDSDTARITAARSILNRSSAIVAGIKEFSELNSFLEKAKGACGISFGDNKNALSDFIDEQLEEVDEDLALSVECEKLKSGEYYDYRFLSIAVELTLLDEEARGNLRIREFTSTLLSRLDYFMHNPECEFMRVKENKYEDFEKYLSSLFGIGAEKKSKQLIIIDTSEVDNDILELTTSVISRMVFEYRKKQIGEGRRQHPVHLILDEAHRYIRKDAVYILQDNIFERIAREGRKFSLYLLVSSQRPSELSSTVLSQCGNYIVHRIQNDLDMKYIYSVLPYFSEDYLIKIKQQIPGEALVFGNCVPMPLQVKVIQANPDPNSKNCQIKQEWFKSE